MSELHIVALSGGKDSTALAFRLKELEPRPYTYVCTPTGNESDDMFEHWKMLREKLGGTFTPIVAGTLVSEIESAMAIPNWRMRWCTRKLKIEPYAKFLQSATRQYDRVISYVGIRADEPEREAGDYSDISGVEMRFPLREWGWGIGEVITYNASIGVSIPKRTDCKLCFFQRIGEWYELWQTNPEAWAEGERLEDLTHHTFRSPSRDTWPASMRELRAEFEGGRLPRGLQKDGIAELKCRVCTK